MFLAISDGFIMFQKPDGIRGSRLWEEYLVYKNILLHQTYKPPKTFTTVRPFYVRHFSCFGGNNS